ncbi:hypothetical protein SKAU_G00312340 [Synaphobranchus kaupii]|uniref:Reverse transcriptase n=1 Tax=Synaphobranchus kaupii TaxID=118154 RepID=A0A9Q1ERX5_SYNKA|nr:hypothetical protein SKAU_G00312340 [Synaphobranchus kaupii]
MDNHHLKLNPGKTELIYNPALTSPPLNLSISLGDTPLTPRPCARNLGVVMDNRLSLSENIAVVTRACRFFLYNIRRIHPFLTTHSTQLLVQAMVLSRWTTTTLSWLACQHRSLDPFSLSRTQQRAWSSISPDTPMSPPCSLTSTGYL